MRISRTKNEVPIRRIGKAVAVAISGSLELMNWVPAAGVILL
jgi:hypothetical protein